MTPNNQDSFWKRLSYKYRFSIMNEDTLMESWHVRLSRMGAFVILVLLFVLTLGIFSALIIFTPIRNVLPGYNESIRRQLVDESMKLDSIGTSIELQRQYLNIIRDVVAGTVSTDTVQTLDSLEIVMRREQLMQAKNDVTADFVAQYEAKEKDNMVIFDVTTAQPANTFFCPVKGDVVQGYDPRQGRHGVNIAVNGRQTVTSILAGTIIMTNYEIDNTYTMVIQHGRYLSVYRHLQSVMKQVGTVLEAGDAVAVVAAPMQLEFELWQNGSSIDPEEVVVF